MKSSTKHEFDEWMRWYHWQHDNSMSLDREVKFLRTAVKGLFKLVCALYDEQADKQLYLPNAIGVDRGAIRVHADNERAP